MPKFLKDATPEEKQLVVNRLVAEALAATGMVADPVTGEIRPETKSKVVRRTAKARGIPIVEVKKR